MKDEKEMKWIVLLFNSSHCSLTGLGILTQSACKKDFERLLGSSESNKEFNLWFKKMIEEGVFFYKGKITRGYNNNVITNGYIVNSIKLGKYAKQNQLYNSTYRFFNRDRVI